MKLRPLHDRVIVKRMEEERVSAGGIVIPDSATEKPVRGEIIAAGNGKILENGEKRGLDVKVGAAFFNDAGIGKNRSGISGLDLLQDSDIIAIAVSHETAEIANGRDTYENGIVSFVNERAEKAEIKAGMTVKETVNILRSYLKDS